MVSNLWLLPSARAISSTSGAMLPASFRTGMTMETAGGAAMVDVSLMLGPRFWWGDQLAADPFDARPGRPGERPDAAVGLDGESEPARREPVAHQQRADHTDNAAQNDVAREVRREHDAAQRDDDGVRPQERPRARPQRADGHGDGES